MSIILSQKHFDMVKAENAIAEKHTFKISPEERLKRFLILGIMGSKVQANQREGLDASNMKNLVEMVRNDPIKAVQLAVQYSDEGRVIKNDTSLLVLAVALSIGDLATKRLVGEHLSKVARTGTHILHFTKMVDGLRGWGRLARKTVANWYLAKPAADLAYQVAKYKQRDGWSHRDVMRVAHPNPEALPAAEKSVFTYVVKGYDAVDKNEHLPKIITAMQDALTAPIPQLVNLIRDNRLSHEMVPNEAKGERIVWQALLPSMGITALVRNLAKLTVVGVIGDNGESHRFIVDQLSNPEKIRQSRIHPMAVLTAWEIYRQGSGMKGSLRWVPNRDVIFALERAFYASFGNVEKTHKSFYLGIDVSGSMGARFNQDLPLTSAQIAAVMAMITARKEENSQFWGFSRTYKDLKISASDTLEQVLAKTHDAAFGSTNCAAPMLHALQAKMAVDVFAIYTDNDTNSSPVAPAVALNKYRDATGTNAKLIVMATMPYNFSIADPNDAGMLDLVGFDSGSPQVIAEFVKG